MITAHPEVLSAIPSEVLDPEPAPRPSPERWLPWLLFLGFLCLYGWRLSLMALWDNDETTYAEIAREMLQGGDWITLHFRYHEWFCHPPLYFWLVASLDRVLGFCELAARLPAAIAGAALIPVVYQWGRRMLSPRAALIGALCLGINFQMYTESRMALLDTMLHVFSFLAILGMWDGFHDRPAGFRRMFVASGLACLCKGPFGLLFPWLLALPYLLLTGQLRRLRTVPWLWSLVALAIGGTWYGVEIWLHGRPFFDTVLVYFAIKRMTVQIQGQGGPWWVYLAITAAGLFPWSVYLPGTLASLARQWVRERRDVVAMLLVAILVPFVFFTIAETKLPNYIVFSYPGIALGTGWWLDDMLTRERVRQLWIPTNAAAIIAILFVAGMKFWAEPRNPKYGPEAFAMGEVVCGGLALFLAVATSRCLGRSKHGPVPFLAGGMALFLLSCSTFLAPMAEQFRPIKALGLAARPLLSPDDRLTMYGLTGEFGLTFYAQHYVIPIASEHDFRRVFNTPGKVLAVLSEPAFQSLSATVSGNRGVTLYPVVDNGRAVLVSNQPVPATQ